MSIRLRLVEPSAEALEDFPGPWSKLAHSKNGVAEIWFGSGDLDYAQLHPALQWVLRHGLTLLWIGTPGTPQNEGFVSDERPVQISPFPETIGRNASVEALGLAGGNECSRCLSPTALEGDARSEVSLRFLRPDPPGLFTIGRMTRVASEEFLAALRAVGLDSGLTVREVGVENNPLKWFILGSSTVLEQPPAPFGWWHERCPDCGKGTSRRYETGRTWLRPAAEVCWMQQGGSGGGRLMVLGRVLRWILGPGARFLSERSIENGLQPGVYGWYPEDAGYFFMPRKYHAADTVVTDPSVLPYMTFDEVPPPMVRRRAEAAWRKEAEERGRITTMARALGYEPDVVYILDFTDQPMAALRGEDLALFRNLNELILCGTQIASIPDAVFGLRNLRRLDLRRTPVPPAEVERVRAALGSRVQVQSS